MKLIIAGGRDYQFEDKDYLNLDTLLDRITEVVSGCAKGADSCGEYWANCYEIPIKKFPAQWDKYGHAAGPIRNGEMAEYADAVALFPGGRGTESMLREAKRLSLEIFDFRQ